MSKHLYTCWIPYCHYCLEYDDETDKAYWWYEGPKCDNTKHECRGIELISAVMKFGDLLVQYSVDGILQ